MLFWPLIPIQLCIFVYCGHNLAYKMPISQARMTLLNWNIIIILWIIMFPVLKKKPVTSRKTVVTEKWQAVVCFHVNVQAIWIVIIIDVPMQSFCWLLFLLVLLQEYVTWPRGLKLACACYLASVSISEPETKTPWVARAPKNKDPLKWFIMACSRLSQVGER